MRSFRSALVSLLALAFLVQGVVPANASVASEAPFVASDYVTGLAAAKLRNHRILITGELTQSSTTWVNPDGTLTTDSVGSPIRVRDASGLYGWRDLDFTLQFAADGRVVAKSGLLQLSISGGGSAEQVEKDGLVSATNAKGEAFGFGWGEPLPKPILEGNVARFVDVLPSVDLLVRLDATGFEQFFEVKSKPSAETLDRLRVGVSSRNVSVVENATGGIDFVSAASKKVASILAPVMFDSSGAEQDVAKSENLDPILIAGKSGQVLDLNLASTFFDRPDVVYPVIVDPTISLDPTFDTYVSSAYLSTDFQSSTELLVGTPDSGASKYRSFLSFESTSWRNQDIVSANLDLYLQWSWSCTAKPFTVYAATTSSSATRWGNQPTLYSTAYVSNSAAAGYNSSCSSKTVSTNVTDTVAYLAPLVYSTAGFGIRASETDSTGWKRFASDNSATHKPILSVTYNRYPNAPMAITASNSVSESTPTLVGSLKPLLSTSAVDPDSNAVSLTFNTYATASATYPSGTLCSVQTGSGQVAGCRPSSALVDGQTYFVRATANDGRVESALGPVFTFKVAATEPNAPVISCPFANNYSSDTPPAADFNCTVTTSASPATHAARRVTVVLDDSLPQTFETNTDGSSSNQILLKTGAVQHRISAIGYSSTSVPSQPSNYTLTFGVNGVIVPQKVVSVASDLVLSVYAKKVAGIDPTTASIQWRKFGASATSWLSAETGLNVEGKLGFKGLYNYKFDVTTLGLSGPQLLNQGSPETINVRVCFTYQPSGDELCTSDDAITATRLPSRFGSAAAAAGPGQVSLTSGAFRMSETDFNQTVGLDSLSVSRSYNNVVGTTNDEKGIFGPGWVGSLGSDAAAISNFKLQPSNTAGTLVYLTDDFGSTLTFSKNPDGSYDPFDEDTSASEVSLQKLGSTFVATESDGSQSTFTQASASSTWQIKCAKSSINDKDVVSTYNASGQVTSLGYSSACTSSTQGLSFEYIATSGGQRLSKVFYVAFNPATQASLTTQVVSYGYDSAGRLQTVTDSRSGQQTAYSYDSANRVSTYSVTGFAPYKFSYDPQGRLTQVARSEHVFVFTFDKVETTFVYGTPTTSTVGLPNLPNSETAKWGQTEAPVFATAVFDAQKAIGLDSYNAPITSSLSAQDWTFADFTFTNSNGSITNTATWGKTKWLYSANLFTQDQAGYATFDQQGIERVLEQTIANGVGKFDPLDFATVVSYKSQVNNHKVLPGLFIDQTWSPIRTITNQDQTTSTVRTHTQTFFDESAPSTKLYGLQTSQIIGLTLDGGLKSTNSTQLSKTITSYNPIDGTAATSATSGWVLNQPTTTQSFDANNVLISESKVRYNVFGQVIKAIQPGSNGSDARTELTSYYSQGAQTNHPECGLRPQWENLVCVTEYPSSAGQPIEFVESYDYYLNASKVVETTPNGFTRTTTNTFTADNLLASSTIAVPNQAAITTENVYDSQSRLQIATKLFYGGVFENQTSQTFDDWGRKTSYTNAINETETTTYVPSGQKAAGSVLATSNPAGTTTYVFEATSRALVTGSTFSNSGSNAFSYTYTATYNELGQLTSQAGENNIQQSFNYNDANQIQSMSYKQGTNILLTWSRTYDAYSRVLTETEPTTNSYDPPTKTNTYSYDSSGRLTSNDSGTACTSYAYDNAGNRTSLTKGNCATSTTTTHTYNSASQLTNSGYVYDQLGRNISIPALDAPKPSNGVIALTYNANDTIAAITQNATTSFTYDAEARRLNENSFSQTTTRHYTDESDNPTWVTQSSTSKTEIYTPSLGPGLNITTTIQNSTKTAELQLTDLRGNSATTIDLATNNPSPWSSYDEFGNPTVTNPASTNLVSYTTYAQAGRATNTTGLILMGVRVYNPVTNQFTSSDPLSGGNENKFTYPSNPLSTSDFGGAFCTYEGGGPSSLDSPEICYKVPHSIKSQPVYKNLLRGLNAFGTTRWKKFEFSSKPLVIGVFSKDPKNAFNLFRGDRRFSTLNIRTEWTWERNQHWLETAMSNGRPIIIAHNPYASWGIGGKPGVNFRREINLLFLDGYKFVYAGNQLWLAVKEFD